MIRKAFLPGAGLGTRLRPLTDLLPKPLVPLFHRPLIAWAMDSCHAAGITDFAINTHHLPEKWETDASGEFRVKGEGMPGGNGLPSKTGSWQGHPLHLFHEPELLETGGGVKNIEAWTAGESVLVHNGDIFSSLALDRLIAAHEASGNPVTLAVRSHGDPKHVAIAVQGDRVVDIRHRLGRSESSHIFAGIYCFTPELLGMIPAGEMISVIPAFLELARQNRLGAAVLDEGHWADLGDPAAYLDAHRDLALAPAVHPDAIIDPAATIARSVIGPRAEIAAGAVVRDSVIWPGAKVGAGEVVDSRIVTG
ncbi:sugar phosphate nucleotidyltransferase [Luteolibacter flavescens]|uniref:Sugar phosphate nucleotidyltransferase n=1 Tax=Luteolibacter flavescens TaxID=1859460 RepID=A0ABT3FM35_9BACT|nr:sugar phosphate nucleotidyltransferase [Luteolibacter flavescens]MCW1884628.1 sugar phosphate nucleotidyltransferase [Luteolibacter flavescens]